MKILRVGDPHAKVSNLEEMGKLIKYVLQIAREQKVDQIEILGDLFHTHAILRLEVLNFWREALEVLSEQFQTLVLVGNHDQTGDYNSHISALDVFSNISENLIIVKAPVKFGVFAYVPYIHGNDAFIQAANHLATSGAKILVCHQTFGGSKFENGFYAPDGINPDDINFNCIISGHIHAQQEFGKVIYPGTARWDSASDANQPKGIWVYDHGTDGGIKTKSFYSTESVCRPILFFSYSERDLEPPTFPAEALVALELVGSSDWVSKQKAIFKGKCSIKTKITDTKKTENRQAGENFDQFLRNLYVSTMDKEHLVALAKEYGLV